MQQCRAFDLEALRRDRGRVGDEQRGGSAGRVEAEPVSYTHLRAHETVLDLVCRLLLEKKQRKKKKKRNKQTERAIASTTSSEHEYQDREGTRGDMP